MDDCLRNLTIRKDQGYVSEVNSCDSGHEAVSLPDEIVPVSEISILNEKDSDELKLELAKIKQVRIAVGLSQIHTGKQHSPTKHRKELQGTENSAKNYKELQDTFKRSTK